MAKLVDLTGQKYGRLTVLHQGKGRPRTNGQMRVTWICKCECGRTVEVQSDALRSGNSKSCGCYSLDRIVERNTKHGYATRANKASEYGIRKDMKKRCKHHETYRNVEVCDRWADNFENFLQDMGPRPSPKHSIDRINPYGNYEPSNFRWATPTVQGSNKRNTRRVEWNGEKMSTTRLARMLGVDRKRLGAELDRGCSVEEAIHRAKPTRRSRHRV